MELFVEIGKVQLNKDGEELCGDNISITRHNGSIMIVTADGLGSGVKANILSTLTVKMAATMLEKGAKIEDVIETMANTLPVCKVRQLAYSTLSILRIARDGGAYLVEYDNPPAFIGHGSQPVGLTRMKRSIGDKTVREAFFCLRTGDWIVLVSDGVLNAGIGGIWNLGWGWERVNNYLLWLMATDVGAQEAAEELARVTNKLYDGRPGDDASIVVIKTRPPRYLTLLVGPPQDPAQDEHVVEQLMSSPGKKVVCGGTTGNMVGRVLTREVVVDLSSMTKRIPPIATIDGIDLVTEGVLTLLGVVDRLRADQTTEELEGLFDGASRLAYLLLEADYIHFIIGRAINPAHQREDLPSNLALKQKIVEEIMEHLTAKGKGVTVDYY
jgi:hypothetical protein